MALVVMASSSGHHAPQGLASKPVHRLLHVLDLRRRGEAMADEASPLLKFGRITETDGVVFDCLPAHEQPVAARLFHRTSQFHAMAALRALENRPFSLRLRTPLPSRA